MNKLKISLSILLVLFILAGIQLLKLSEVQAAGEHISFPNIRLTDEDVLEWDDIKDSINGTVDLEVREWGSEVIIMSSVSGKSTHSIDLWDMFVRNSKKAGTYKITLEADEITGKKYYYEFKYEYSYYQLAEVKNIKLDSKRLTWEFEDPGVADYKDILFNVSVTVHDKAGYEVLDREYQGITSNEMPSSSFLIPGEHRYVIYVKPYSDVYGYRSPFKFSASRFTLNCSGLSTVTGLRVDGDFVTWDYLPDAEKYDVHFKRRKSGSYSYSPVLTRFNSVFMPCYFKNNNFEQDVEVCVAALDAKGEVIGSYASVIYHFSGEPEVKYPIYKTGKQLTSYDNLAYLTGSNTGGRTVYDPSANRLLFLDVDTGELYYEKTDPLFYSTETLTVGGCANIDFPNEIIKSDKDVVIEDGCNLTFVSDKAAVSAANIHIKGGQLDLKSRGTEALSASGLLKIDKNCSSMTLETLKADTPAMTSGSLTMKYIKIAEPVNGNFVAGKKSICDEDGTPARKVRLVHFVPTPTPTATPTAAPIVKPTVNPTVKPSSVSLTLDKNKASVVCGKTATLKATLKGSTSKITWKSSDTKVATVDSNGKVKAKMAGEVTITASAAGKSAKCVVTVLYKDVTNSKDFWYAPTNYLTAKGVVKGYDKQTKFKPANKCTRAQMVTFIWRLQGEPAPKAKTCKFKDVKKTDYFYKACIWGNENHIVEGYKDGTFGPQIVCARKHAVTFLWRLAKKPKPSSTKNKFKDVKKSDYFYQATLWASEKKILAGYDDGTFRPNGDCLRRQMVTFLYKYDKYVNGKG